MEQRWREGSHRVCCTRHNKYVHTPSLFTSPWGVFQQLSTSFDVVAKPCSVRRLPISAPRGASETQYWQQPWAWSHRINLSYAHPHSLPRHRVDHASLDRAPGVFILSSSCGGGSSTRPLIVGHDGEPATVGQAYISPLVAYGRPKRGRAKGRRGQREGGGKTPSIPENNTACDKGKITLGAEITVRSRHAVCCMPRLHTNLQHPGRREPNLFQNFKGTK